MRHVQSTAISRRLLPLYLATFFQSVPLWYAIEKLFMVSIGFTTASIGLMVAIMSAVMLLVDTPAGILADRWSRKGVMVLGCLALFTSAIVGALSFSVPIYILSTVFWGMYAALYTGAYDSVVYDTVMEEDGNSKRYNYYLGRLRAIEGSAFVIGAIVGGVLAGAVGMRQTYIISLSFIALALLFLARLREPLLHKAEVAEPVFAHIRQTLAVVLRRPVLLPIVLATVGFGIIQESLFELSQVWFIAVATPIVLYGVFSAAVYSSWTTGGVVATRIKSRSAMIVLMLAVLIATIGLVVARNFVFVLVVQAVLAVGLVALGVLLSNELHDELPSRLRAGSSSVVSTLARIGLIPSSLIFTAFAAHASVFTATYIYVGIALVSVAAFLLIPRLGRRFAKDSI